MSVTYQLSDENIERLQTTIKQYQQEAEVKINQYLHGKGYDMFEKAIHNAIPESGRRWNGKKTAARKANSLQDENVSDNLSVTIKARKNYRYLYFPDDGSNTLHHCGNQRFFEKGVESNEEQAVNDMVELLTRLED